MLTRVQWQCSHLNQQYRLEIKVSQGGRSLEHHLLCSSRHAVVAGITVLTHEVQKLCAAR